jgi:hypothetical protein
LRILIGGLLVLSAAGPVVADNVSPYRGQINTEIRGLSDQGSPTCGKVDGWDVPVPLS